MKTAFKVYCGGREICRVVVQKLSINAKARADLPAAGRFLPRVKVIILQSPYCLVIMTEERVCVLLQALRKTV
ncbi:hypothetical protein DC498_15750 [Terrimonas sp.]|nr:hypothetical protein DC498_15750 [Terrimonas sp.]